MSRAYNVINANAQWYGEMYEDPGSPTTIAAAAQDTYYPWISASAGIMRGFTFTNDNVDGDYLTVPLDGLYLVTWNGAFSGTASTQWHGSVFVDAVETACHAMRMLGAGGDVGSWSGGSIISMTEGQKLRWKVQRLTGGAVSKDYDLELQTVNVVFLAPI